MTDRYRITATNKADGSQKIVEGVLFANNGSHAVLDTDDGERVWLPKADFEIEWERLA